MNGIRIINKKYIPILLLVILSSLFISPDVFAAVSSSDESIKNRTDLLININWMIKAMSYLIGFLLLIKGGLLMKDIADQKVKVGYGAVVVVFLSSTIILSYTTSLSHLIPTLLGEESGYCFSVSGGDTNTSGLEIGKAAGAAPLVKSFANNCWNPETSEVSSAMYSKINKMANETVAKDFLKNLQAIISLFQIIGSVYFIKGVYGLYENAMGTAREPGYGKPIITILFTSLLIDLGHTLELLLATLRHIGITF